MFMTNRAVVIGTCIQSMTFPNYLSSKMHLQKLSDQTKFQSWIVNFRPEVYAKTTNLALALKWIKKIEATSSLNELINQKSITGKDFSDYEELDLMMTAELKRCYDIAYLIHEITERGAVTKGAKFLHRAEDWRMFSSEDNWICSNGDICNCLHTHATGRRWTMWKEVGDAKRSHLEQVSSSVPKVKEQTDVKNSNSLKASPGTGVINSLSMVDKMKKIVMWFSTFSRVS